MRKPSKPLKSMRSSQAAKALRSMCSKQGKRRCFPVLGISVTSSIAKTTIYSKFTGTFCSPAGAAWHPRKTCWRLGWQLRLTRRLLPRKRWPGLPLYCPLWAFAEELLQAKGVLFGA